MAFDTLIKFEYQRSFRPTGEFPETVIMTFKDKTFQVLEHICPVQVIATLREGRDIPVYKLNWNGRSIGIFQTLIGGAGTAGLLEEALAMGAKKVLLYGACGVLDEALAAGHFILPTQAYRDEGTSYHYLPVGDYVDIPTSEHLGEIFDELHLPYVKGRVWTTDAFYRETRNNMEKRKADGCIAVDMECASVMAVAQFRGRRSTSSFTPRTAWTGAPGTAAPWERCPHQTMKSTSGWRWRWRRGCRGAYDTETEVQHHGTKR